MGFLSFHLVLSITIATLFLLFLGAIFLKKRSLRTAFTTLMVFFSILNCSWLLGVNSGFLYGLSGALSIATLPLATITVLLFLYPQNPGKRLSSSLLLALPTVGFGSWVLLEGLGPDQIYDVPLIYLFTIVCACIGIMESTWGWFKSRILRRHCYLFSLSLLVLMTTGPLYGLELEVLGFQSLKGASLGSAIFGALFLAPLLMANPIVMDASQGTPAKRKSFYSLEPRRGYAISEKRPKYCYTFFKDIESSGCPSLLITCASPMRLAAKYRLRNTQIMRLSCKDTSKSVNVTNLARILSTIALFLERTRKPVVLIDCIHYLLSNNNILEVSEMIQDLMGPLKKRRGWLLLSFSLLTRDEKAELASLGLTHLNMPPPEEVIAKILSAHTGELSSHLLRLTSKLMNKRVRDFRVEDIPEISRVVSNTIAALGKATNEYAIMKNWESQSKSIQDSLYHFYRVPVSFLATGKWRTWDPLRKEGRPRTNSRDDVREESRKRLLDTEPSQVNLRGEISGILTKSLGDFGRDLLRIECASLGINERDITFRDAERIAERVAKTISQLGDFVDEFGATESMRIKANNLKKELRRISKEVLA